MATGLVALVAVKPATDATATVLTVRMTFVPAVIADDVQVPTQLIVENVVADPIDA